MTAPLPGRLAPLVARTLPSDVRAALVEASRIEPNRVESARRIAEINRVAQHARLKYPQLFQPQ